MCHNLFKEGVIPKQTFYNLSKLKQNKIIGAAQIEFFNYGYDLSSIQRIIKACEISRGSFYQYFTDKKDLFFEILRLIVNRKLTALEPAISNADNLGFFNLIELTIKLGFEYARNNPQDVKIAESIFNSNTLKIEEIMEFILSRHTNNKPFPGSIEFYNLLIKKAQNRGEIDSSIDTFSASLFIKNMLESLNTSLMKNHFSDGIGPEAEKNFYDFLTFIKTGLMARGVNNEQRIAH